MILEHESHQFQQYFCAFTVSLGALFIGTNLAWTSPCLKFFLTENYTTPAFVIEVEEGNRLAALIPFGALVGSIPAGMISDLQGRKKTIIQIAALQISASILATFSNNLTSIYIARFILGLVMGAYCVLIPMYITEIAEKSIRGNLASLFELLINTGVLYAYFLGLFDSYVILSHCITAAMLIYAFGLLLVPESPFYLMLKNRKTDAEKCLTRLRGPNYDITKELMEMETLLENTAKQKLTYAVLTRRENLKGLSYATLIMMFQQLSGIVPVVYFGESIFIVAKVSSPTLCTVILGCTQIFGTFISGILVDRVGRRSLLIISGVDMIICLTTLGGYFWLQERKVDTSTYSWLPVIFLVIYMFGFSIGFGPISWLMMGEFLGPAIKKFAFGIVCVVSLAFQIFMIISFQWLTELKGMAITFWLYSCACLLAVVFVVCFLPETKNKSLQEIQNELAGQKTKNNIVDNSLPDTMTESYL